MYIKSLVLVHLNDIQFFCITSLSVDTALFKQISLFFIYYPIPVFLKILILILTFVPVLSAIVDCQQTHCMVKCVLIFRLINYTYQNLAFFG